ncbi:LysR family transcriptional regulator [Limibaculum sp. FT325]|nr:LysR family transcriptional regulator [Limibaculum sediminis]MCL5777237.1 LysR family transcriptional regulator [Limibaculum sediminis]
MTDWDDLRFVLAAAREGGFSGAARALGVNHATVSRRIAGLEARLGVRLFDRLPRGIVPTAAGERALETARRAEAEMLGLAQDLAGRDRALAGPLTVTAPQLLIAVHLAGVFAAYGARHPGVELTVNASNVPLNLHRREADVAIRVSNAPEDTLVGRRASGQRRAFYLARGYLDAHRAAIEAPGAETGLDCLAFPVMGGRGARGIEGASPAFAGGDALRRHGGASRRGAGRGGRGLFALLPRRQRRGPYPPAGDRAHSLSGHLGGHPPLAAPSAARACLHGLRGRGDPGSRGALHRRELHRCPLNHGVSMARG